MNRKEGNLRTGHSGSDPCSTRDEDADRHTELAYFDGTKIGILSASAKKL